MMAPAPAARLAAVLRGLRAAGSAATTAVEPAPAPQTAADEERQFAEQGFFIRRNCINPAECERAIAASYRAIEAGKYVGKEYPAPGKITIARNHWDDPDLAFIAGHPAVLDAISPLLGGEARLQAFVSYLRTPTPIAWEAEGDEALAAERSHHDGAGASSPVGHAGKHCDYKRWRPVGSSMEWLFVIIPLTDFDTTRPLLIAPGSHLLREVVDTSVKFAKILHVFP